jgi:hypothetical protein
VPTLDLRFADNKSLVDAVTGASLVTFTRASDGTFVDSAGVIQTAATDVPRFDHNPTTGESLGLLVEEQRTNLLLNSEDFSGATTFRGSITANVIAAPDGATTADLFTENTETGNHVTQFGSVAFTTGVTYTVSIFLRPNGRDTNIRFRGTNATTFAAEAFFNLTGAGAVASTVFGTASIQALPNGWYRCIITGVSGATATTSIQVITSSGAGDGTSGVYLWGTDLQAGAFPTSYIPTTTAAVTRSADVATDTTRGAALRTLYAQFRSPASGTRPIVSLDDNSANERIELFTSGTDPKLLVTDGGSAQADIDAGAITANTTARLGARFNTDNFAASISGSAEVLDATGTMPTVDRIRIGRDQAGNYLNGTIARIAGWDTPLVLLPTITQ